MSDLTLEELKYALEYHRQSHEVYFEILSDMSKEGKLQGQYKERFYDWLERDIPF